MSGTCPACAAPVVAGARFCASCGTRLGPAPAEERKVATIMFADVTGSTDLGDQLDPERVRALLQDYFSAMTAIVTTWGGTVEKYIGDAILAVWGVPAAREDDPIRALHAAREMLAELERLNDGFEARHGVRLGMRIGVNTGEVLAPVGGRPGGQFLVSGDAVNVASRLQQVADPGTTLVGERTWSSARRAFAFSPPTVLPIKGKREPISARSPGNPINSGDARTLFHSPMVGRERELSTLMGLLDEAIESGTPRLVVVSGPAGIGKSRMLREMIAEAAEVNDSLLVLRGRCLAAGHGITFWALGEILRSAASISLDEPAETAVAKLEQCVAGPLAAIGLNGEEIARTAAALATSANLPLSPNALEGLDPEAVFQEISLSWPRFVSGIARAWPVAILIEDIHWADERMLTLIEMLAARSQGPILLVATARPEFVEAHPGFGTGQDASVVSLRPLTVAQSARLIDELVGSTGLPDAIVDDMRAKADGNPFFLEEMLQRLVDEGALVNDNGVWHATSRAANVQLSDNVHGLLAARIDALPAPEKQLLQEASVVGRIFWPGAVIGGDGNTAPSADAADALRSLERRGLVAVRPTSTIENEPEYMFRHVLIHDVAYSSVPKARRARAHAGVARWIEHLAGDRLDEFGELIAHHYSAAMLAEDADLAWAERPSEREETRARAFVMLMRAGDSARHRFAIDKAVQLHTDALAIASGTAELSAAHEALGDDHESLYRGDEAVAQYLLAIDQAEQEPRSAERIAGLVAKAARMTIRWGSFRETPPIDRIEQLIEHSLRAPVPDAVRAPLLIASAGLGRGPSGAPIGAGRVLMTNEEMPDLGNRVASIQEGLAIAQRLDDAPLQFMAYELLSIVFQSSGHEERYRETCEQAVTLLDRLPSARQQVDLLVSASGARADAGRYASALESAEDAFARSVGLSPHERMHAAWEIYRAAEPLGRWDRIEELLPWYAAASAAEGEITCAAVRAGPALGGSVVARRGRLDRALELVPVSSPTTPEDKFLPGAVQSARSGTFGGMAVISRYLWLTGHDDEANELVSHALERADAGFLATGIPPIVDTLLGLGRLDDLASLVPIANQQMEINALIAPTIERAEALLALESGETAAAAAKLRSAASRFDALSAPYEAARTREMLAELVADNERRELLAQALRAYEELDAAPRVRDLRAALEAQVVRLS